MELDPVRVENTRAWVVRAVDDLSVAAHDLQATVPFVRAALFHCQQGVEKALKAFLTWHDRPFRKTHELRRWGEECIRIDPSLEAALEPSFDLTEAAWLFRYRGAVEEPSFEEAQQSLALAQQAVDAILARLPAEVRP